MNKEHSGNSSPLSFAQRLEIAGMDATGINRSDFTEHQKQVYAERRHKEITEWVSLIEERDDAIRSEARADALRENNKRLLCVVRNIRSKNSKAWNKRTVNWVLISDYFGYGSTSATKLCNELGIDPDGFRAAITQEGSL